jgi:hypothetical protein
VLGGCLGFDLVLRGVVGVRSQGSTPRRVVAGLGWPLLRSQLEGNGGYCDCEVLMNLFPVDDAPD